MDETPRRSRSALRLIGRTYGRFVRTLTTLVFGVALLVLGALFLNYVVLSTPKDRAYRDLSPSVSFCAAGLAKGWSVLAETGRPRLTMTMQAPDGGWADPSDDETAVIAKDPAWRARFQCALQHHVIPSLSGHGTPLDYYLGFLEFKESGEPYALVSADAGSTDVQIDAAMLRQAMMGQMRTGKTMAQIAPVITQLDVLKHHLATGKNFVIVFIHGWRHGAEIGDNNVADTRLYAAHVARFVAARCPSDPTFCDMKVTAIYVGWRGGRVDEAGLADLFGSTLGGAIGTISAAPTLFDRKPVAEAIAPGAISALRAIEGVLAPKPGESGPNHNRMIVVGHSLGGDMLASGLEADLVKAVQRHKPGEILPPVLGDLVVLVNPAAEAAKWTAVQREVWRRTAFVTGPNTPTSEVLAGNDLFPIRQKPVLVSITAALAFPAGGLRPGDCAWIGLDVADRFARARARIRERLAATDRMFDAGADYDWATHDLFPTFEFDFRPAAAYLDRVAAHIEGRQPAGLTCSAARPAGLVATLETLPLRALAVLIGTFPFQRTAPEETRSIGNLDPPRPADGVLADAVPSAAPFGTTHELMGHAAAGLEPHHPYATLADAPLDCPVSNRWLYRARLAQAAQHGLFWDSDKLAAPEPGLADQNPPRARFLHGLELTGIAPITRADDPFWNIRAFDNELARHDGYRLSSFICAISQLVLDDTTGSGPALTNHLDDPDHPRVNAEP